MNRAVVYPVLAHRLPPCTFNLNQKTLKPPGISDQKPDKGGAALGTIVFISTSLSFSQAATSTAHGSGQGSKLGPSGPHAVCRGELPVPETGDNPGQVRQPAPCSSDLPKGSNAAARRLRKPVELLLRLLEGGQVPLGPQATALLPSPSPTSPGDQ